MPNHLLNRSLVASLTAMALLVASPAALTQAELQPAIEPGTDSFYGREPTQGVYVRDSAVALEKFPLVARLERMNEWGKAADVLQEILEEFPDRVIQTATNADGEIVRYTSVANAVTQQIARWPDEGLNAYRARFEPAARARLQSIPHNDIAGLRTIYAQHFNTEPGLQAGVQLVDLYFRAGDFRSARDIANRLLTLHPLLDTDRPALLYRAGLLAHLTGDTDIAQAYATTLAREHPDAAGIIRGAQTGWAQSLRDELTTTPAAAQALAPESWPILGGDPTRARVSTAPGRMGARLFQIPLGAAATVARAPAGAVSEMPEPPQTDNGATIGVMPVVDGNELFFQDGRRIYGVSLESGLPLPGWAETHAASGGAYTTDAPAMPAGQQLNVTLTADAVIAIMGFPQQPGEMHGNALSRIVCLDRATGRQRWVIRPSDLPDQDALRTLNFSGSPLVIGNAVHFLGRGGKGAQFEDCYLITLDLQTGAHAWSTYIASASTQQANMFGGRGAALSSDTTSHVAYAGGRLFVLTNLGAIAAVDAHSGIIDWLSVYERSVQTDPTRRRRFGAHPRVELPQPWTFNPVMVQADRLFILPTDANGLLIYDAGTGELVKTIRSTHLDRPDTIVGVHGDRLVVSGGERVKAINWQRYDADEYTDRNVDMIYWPRQFSGSPIRGRPFMTAESIFVPTQHHLYQMDQKTGRIVASHPGGNVGGNTSNWDGAGNVIVTGDRVVIATATSVDVYTDLRVAQAKLDAEVAAAPQDPNVRLRYAEVMFVANQEDLSLAKLDEAIELLGGRDHMQPSPARERLFHTALAYAEQVASRGGANPPPLAAELYDRAAAAAASASQQVQYRISRGELAMRAKDFATAAELAQQILDDPQMRLVTINDPRGGGATQAAAVAEHAIAALIRQNGRDLYAPFDALAEQAVAAADGDPDALLATAARYPNARVAPQALLSAAEAFEASSNHRLATQTLRQITHKFPDAFNKAIIIESMARNYLAMPNRSEVAISRLEHGVRTAGNPRLNQQLTLPDGSTIEDVSFSEAAAAIRAYARRAERQAPPDFRLPTREWGLANRGKSPFPDEARQRIPDIDALVTTMPGMTRHDRIITWGRRGFGSESHLEIYAVGQTRPIGASRNFATPPQEAAWIDAGLVVWAPQQIALLDGDDVTQLWNLQLDALPDVQLVESPADALDSTPGAVTLNANQRVRIVGNRVVAENALTPPKAQGAEHFIQAQITADRALLITSSGRLIAINLSDGTLAWQTRLLQDAPIDRVVANDDFTVVRLIGDSRVDLVVFDTYSGELISRRGFSTAGAGVPLNFAIAPDGTLVYVLPDRLCGKDLYDPGEQLTWEVPGQAPGQRVYEGATHPDHLRIHDGRIMVLSDEGQFVRVHSLQTGRLIRYPSGQRNRDVDALLSTGNQDWSTRLLIDGSYMYCLSPRSLVAYNLDNPEQTWRGPNDPATSHSYRDALIGRDYLVLLDAPGAAGPQAGSPRYTLYVFSRTQTRNGESGLMVHSPSIQERGLIKQWAGVEGGLYYLNDRTLHFLKGIRE